MFRTSEALMTLANIFAFFLVSAATFQRLGALWVAIIIILFGFLRAILAALKAAMSAEQDLRKFTTAESSFGFLRALAPREEYFERLENPDVRNDFSKLFDAIEAQLSKSVYPAEILLLAVATLQWGFGDLLHCFLNGNGWSTC